MRLKTVYISIVIALSFLFPVKVLLSQESHDAFFIESKLHYGFLFDHRQTMSYKIESHIPAIEFNIGKPTYGKQLWEQVYHYPSYGIGFYRANLGNPDIFGFVNALYPYINIPAAKTDKFSLNYNFALGLSYLNKHFDPVKNYYNLVIGSSVNIYCHLGIDAKIHLFKRVRLINGIGLTHFSNCAIKTPNLGINVIAYYAGIRYMLGNNNVLIMKSEPPECIRKFEYSVIYAAGIKEIYPANRDKYFTSSLAATTEKIFNYKHKAGIGLDLFYDASIYKRLEQDSISEISTSDILSSGVHLSYDFVFNKISFTIQNGIYFYSKLNEYGRFYHRMGLKYKFSRHFLANVTLKTHFARADFIECGIGYYW